MKIDEKHVAGAIVLGLLAILFFKLKGSSHKDVSYYDGSMRPFQNQPDKAPPNEWKYDGIFPKQEGSHFMMPNEISNPVVLPVRYPDRAGHEMSVLLDKGYPQLFHPRKSLYAWVDCPPSEEV